jgi:hypothetical protein
MHTVLTLQKEQEAGHAHLHASSEAPCNWPVKPGPSSAAWAVVLPPLFFTHLSVHVASAGGTTYLTMFWSCGATGLRATRMVPGHHAHRAVSSGDVTDMTSDHPTAEIVAIRRLSRTEVIVTMWVDEHKPGNVRSWYSSTQCIQPLVLFTLDPSGLGCKGRCGT